MARATRTRRTASTAAVPAAALAIALAGCALNPPPPASEIQKDALAHSGIPPAWKAPGTASGAAAVRWLASFDDPALTALVTEAQAYNPDLRVAAARVERAAGNLKIAGAGILPSVNLIGHGGGKGGGDGSGMQFAALNASLELDVWGRVRSGEAAAQSQLAATESDYAYARQSIAATVARAWFVAIEAGLQRAIAQELLAGSEALLRLAQERQRIGAGDEQDVALARATVEAYRDALRRVELSRTQSLQALELVVGRYPAAEIAVARQLAGMPPSVPAGLPSELLERRPDVVAAERRVAVAFNRVEEAKAARLPRIALTAGVSALSSDVFVLQDTNNPIWSLGANLVAPIYQGGALQAQVEIRTAEQKQAVAEYAVVAQRAFGDVEGALSAEFALGEREAILARNVAENQRALELVQVQYRVGKVDRRAVEQRQIALETARADLLRVRGERLTQRVNVYLALGGGFE